MEFQTPPTREFDRLTEPGLVQVIVLGVIAAFLIVMLYRTINRRRKANVVGLRSCRWRKDKIKRDGTLQRWQCRTCGVDAFTYDGKPPKECKRGLRETQL